MFFLKNSLLNNYDSENLLSIEEKMTYQYEFALVSKLSYLTLFRNTPEHIYIRYDLNILFYVFFLENH